jgi:glyoxylase-like metal-dependent hydrolase (beta-lactamase superfamily II)
MSQATYKITALSMGTGEVPGPELFWMNDFDKWHTLNFQVFLIQGDGLCALVNTGPPEDLTAMNAGWEAFLGSRARFKRAEGQFLLDQLAREGLRPEQITHIILTPLQLYTTGNVHHFENAEICISERGWTHLLTTKDHPHDDKDTSIPPALLARLVTDMWPRLRLLKDEDVIVPGVTTWWAGSHHRATIAIEVDTAAGKAVITDSFFTIQNLERNRPIGICENIYEAMVAHKRAQLADIILPLYDPSNFERFPGGKIA